MRLALAIVALFTLAADSNAQEPLRPYAPPILHAFLDSANVYPESVTVDQSSGTFFVGSPDFRVPNFGGALQKQTISRQFSV